MQRKRKQVEAEGRMLVWGACGSARSVSRRIGGLGGRLVWGFESSTQRGPATAERQRAQRGDDTSGS